MSSSSSSRSKIRHDNPAQLRDAVLQLTRENQKLRADFARMGQNAARAVAVIEKCQQDRAQALKLLWCLTSRVHGRKTAVLTDELQAVPSGAYVHMDFESVTGTVILTTYDQVPKEMADAAQQLRQESLGQMPLGGTVLEPAADAGPEPEAAVCTCPDRPTVGLRCPTCGLRLP